MDEPRTHYQLSFTVRQGLLLFVALLGALGVAYLFGLLTGLSGRTADATGGAPPSGTPGVEGAVVPASPTPVPEATPAGEALELPRPVRGVSPPGGARRAAPASSASSTSLAAAPPTAVPSPPLPTPSPGLQLFEDEGGPEPTPAPAPPSASRRPRGEKPAVARAPASSFWVQALSASSEKEARALRQRLESHGYPVAVVPGTGPSGKRVFRVRAGPYGSREEAERAAAKLKAREKVQPWVVPPGK